MLKFLAKLLNRMLQQHAIDPTLAEWRKIALYMRTERLRTDDLVKSILGLPMCSTKLYYKQFSWTQETCEALIVCYATCIDKNMQYLDILQCNASPSFIAPSPADLMQANTRGTSLQMYRMLAAEYGYKSQL